jgi:hypothetical protein
MQKPPPRLCFRSSSKTARSCCREVASGGSSHCLSCFYASSVTLGPSSLLENANQPESKQAAANLPHVSTWSVEEVERAPTRISRPSAAEGREISGRDTGEGLSAGRRNSGQGGKMKSQHRGRATQSVLRVGRALEDQVMRVTGALRGAGRNSISGTREGRSRPHHVLAP